MNLESYLNDNYGICSLEKCICLSQGWLGMRCDFWKPCCASTYEELADWQKELTNAYNGRQTEG